MKVKPLAPGMKHFDTSNLRAKIFLVPSQLRQGFCCTGEKQPIQFFLIRQEDWIQLRWNREHHMKVLDIQQIGSISNFV